MVNIMLESLLTIPTKNETILITNNYYIVSINTFLSNCDLYMYISEKLRPVKKL